MSIVSDKLRYEFGKSDKERDSKLVAPKHIVKIKDIPYGPCGVDNYLDVYYDDSIISKNKTILSIHGGGFVYGDKEVYYHYCLSLAKLGFTVVNINYRLAPEHVYPSQLEDINLAVHWMLEDGAIYNIDSSNIYIVGDSAGAYLATVYTAMLCNPDFLKGIVSSLPESFKPRALGLNCGMYDLAQAVAHSNELDFKELFLDYTGYAKLPDSYDEFNVLPYLNKNFPPVYIVTAEHDFLNYQAHFLNSRLNELEVAHEFRIYGLGREDVGHVFHCNPVLDEAKLCNTNECDFFNRYA